VKRSGAWSRRPHPGHFAVGRGRHLIGMSLSGVKVHHQDPLHLECGVAPWWGMWFNHGSDLLSGELASPWRCPLLDGGLPRTGLRLLPPMMSVMSLGREVGFWTLRCHPQGNCRHGLSGQSIIHLWCCCDGNERSPHAAPFGRWDVKAPLRT
jgi:hypothetical protein